MSKLIFLFALFPTVLTPLSDTFISKGPERIHIENGQVVEHDIPCYNESDNSNNFNNNPSFISKDSYSFYWLED